MEVKMAGLYEHLDNICRYVSEKTDGLAQKVSEEVALQKIQSQIREEEREISRICQKIGELVYEEKKEESVTDEKLEPLIATIGMKKASILEYKKRMAKIKNMGTCRYCGEFIEHSALYCPYCGKKIEKGDTDAAPEASLERIDPEPPDIRNL